MKAKAEDLFFISSINRDGSGTKKVGKGHLNSLLKNPFMKDDLYELKRLSHTEGTFLAIGFNSYVVKVKNMEELKKKNYK